MSVGRSCSDGTRERIPELRLNQTQRSEHAPPRRAGSLSRRVYELWRGGWPARLALAVDGPPKAECEIEVKRRRREQRQPPPVSVLAKDPGEDDQPDTDQNPHPDPQTRVMALLP